MKNITIYKAFATILAAAIIAVPAITSAEGLDVGGTETSAASTGLTVGGAGVTAASEGLTVGGQGTNAATVNTGNTNPDLTVGGNGVTAADVDTSTTPPADNNGGNGNGNGSGGSSVVSTGGSSSGGSVLLSGNPIYSTSTCPLITTFMKRGQTNSAVEVFKLQAFLKNVEGINVAITGTFDEATESAVKTFQTKYADTILLPWGGTKNSGIVYITTSKKINELACRQPLTLTASDLAIIKAYVEKNASSETPAVTTVTTPDVTITDANGVTVTLTPEVSSTTETTEANTAAVGNSSIAARFWNFLVNLFR